MNNNSLKVKSSILLFISGIGLIIGGYLYLDKEVTIICKGEEYSINTFSKTVEDVLSEEGIDYDSNDLINPSLESDLSDDIIIEVIDVTTEKQAEYRSVKYDTEVVKDDGLYKGKTEVEQKGKNGEKEYVYELTYYDGVLVEKSLEKEGISEMPVDKIVKEGTKEKVVEEVKVASSKSNDTAKVNAVTASASTSSESSSLGKHMKVESTAYATGTVTATGTKPRWGTIAVDPRIIPYGTKVYIPQFDMTFIAEDTGGAIKGNKIDIYMNSMSQAIDWGRRTIDIYVK